MKHQVSCKAKLKPTVRRHKRERRYNAVKILHKKRNEQTALHVFYRIGIPCRREKYASVAFFMISGLQVMSVNISSSLALVVLRSLDL